jgi:hypothetical protein
MLRAGICIMIINIPMAIHFALPQSEINKRERADFQYARMPLSLRGAGAVRKCQRTAETFQHPAADKLLQLNCTKCNSRSECSPC